jgi:hypothetical protein
MRRIHRVVWCVGFLAVLGGFVVTPDAAAQQSVNVFVGGFLPRGADSRDIDDVLVNDLDSYIFRIRDFRGATVGAEYLVGLGDFFDAGLGIGYYSRTAPSVSRDFVQPDGSEIEQRFRLRIAPISATFRYLPLGHSDAITPYIGAGVGIYMWKYTEAGDFVDPTTSEIFNGTFSGSGTAVGPIILGGVRVPLGRVAIGGEIRYQRGIGDLPATEGFAGSKIDLGGINYLATINVRF